MSWFYYEHNEVNSVAVVAVVLQVAVVVTVLAAVGVLQYLLPSGDHTQTLTADFY